MPLNLLQVQEVVRYFRYFGLKSLLLGVGLLGFEVDSVHRLAELKESLVFYPSEVVCQTALQKVQTSYQFVGLCLLDLVEEFREELNAYASHAPNTV